MNDNDAEANKYIQIGESLLDQAYNQNSDDENKLDTSQDNNLYYNMIQLSNLLNSFSPTLTISDIKQIRQFATKIFEDLEILQQLPSSEIGPKTPVRESYHLLAFTLFKLIKSRRIINNQSHPENPYQNPENSTDLLNFLAEEYDISSNSNESNSPKKEELHHNFSHKNQANNETIEVNKETNEEISNEKIKSMAKLNTLQKKEIEKLKKENESLKSRINMAVIEVMNRSKSNTQAHSNAGQIIALQKEIEDLQGEIDDLEIKNVALIQANKKTNDVTKSLQELNQSQQLQIDQLKLDLIRQKKENKSIEQDITEFNLKSKNAVCTKLKSALEEVSQQMKSLASEVAYENECKNNLYKLIHTQQQIIKQFDTLLLEKENKIIQSSKTVNKSHAIINNIPKEQNNPKQNCNEYSIIESIQKCLSSAQLSDDLNIDINLIIESTMQPIGKISSLFECILKRITKYHDAEKSNRLLESKITRLHGYCTNLLCFFEHIANSGEIQHWLIGETQNEDFRPILLTQCNRIETYLQQYQREIAINSDDFLCFASKINNMIINNEEIDNEIALIFHLSSTANNALIKYAQSLNEMNQILANNLKQLRHQFAQIQSDHHFEEKPSPIIKNKKLSQIYKIIIESNQDNEEETINQCIQLLTIKRKNTKKTEIDQDRLNSVAAKYKRLKKENENLIAQNDLYKQNISRNENENQDLNMNNQVLKRKHENIMNKNKNLEKQLNESRNENAKIKHLLEAQKQELDLNKMMLDNNKKENTEEINKLNKRIAILKDQYSSLEKQNQDALKKVQIQCDEKTQVLEKEKQELLTENACLKSQNEELLNKSKELSQKSSLKEEEYSKGRERYNSTIAQLHSDLAALQSKNKMLQLQLASTTEKVERDKSLIETHYKMNAFNIETKYETELDVQRTKYETKLHEFLTSICEKFKDLVDFNQIISANSVITLLSSIELKLRNSNKEISLLKRNNNDLNIIRNTLHLHSTEEIIPSITRLIEIKSKYSKQQNKSKVERSNPATKEIANDSMNWHNWAQKLVMLASDNFSNARTSQDLQFELEEIINGSIHERCLIKKLNILRREKAILKQKLPTFQTCKRPKIIAVLHVCTFIHRLRNLSGLMTFNFPNFDKQLNDENTIPSNQDIPPKKNFPIIMPATRI